MADSSESPTWPVWNIPWDQTVVILSLPPSFHSSLSLTETESALENFFFHTVPVHSNESIVSENIQPCSEDAEGSHSEKLEPGYCAVFLHTLVKCGVSTPPGICQEASIQAHRACPAGSLKKNERGEERKDLSSAIFPNELCKCVFRRYGNTVRARFGSFFTVAALCVRGRDSGSNYWAGVWGLRWGRGGDTVAKNVWEKKETEGVKKKVI